MPAFRLPLSGNVTQSINPWTWFFNPVGSQVGLVNIELGQSSNPAIEEEVLSDVASYGKQLGRIEDALLVLLAHLRPDRPLTADERARLKASIQRYGVVSPIIEDEHGNIIDGRS